MVSNGSTGKKVACADVISELGILGTYYLGAQDVVEHKVEWLVRTKGTEMCSRCWTGCYLVAVSGYDRSVV